MLDWSRKLPLQIRLLAEHMLVIDGDSESGQASQLKSSQQPIGVASCFSGIFHRRRAQVPHILVVRARRVTL